MKLSIAALLGALVLAPAGCKKTVDGPMPLCSSEVEGGEAEEAQSQNVSPEVWFGLILKSFNSKTGEPARPAMDCTGKSVEIEDEAVLACVTPEDPSPALPPRALDGELDLEVTGAGEGEALVWIRTDYFEDGDALGPIALAQFRSNGVAIRAIGGLRANPNRVRMRLEPFGEGSALVVESMVCDPEDDKKCARVVRILPRVRDRFVERPLVDKETGECIGAATFELNKELEITREKGGIRRFELVRTIDFKDGTVTVKEQVLIKDLDPDQPDAPPAVFRKAHTERPLQMTDAGLSTSEPLWERMLAEHGSVEVKRTPPPKPDADAAAPADETAEG